MGMTLEQWLLKQIGEREREITSRISAMPVHISGRLVRASWREVARLRTEINIFKEVLEWHAIDMSGTAE